MELTHHEIPSESFCGGSLLMADLIQVTDFILPRNLQYKNPRKFFIHINYGTVWTEITLFQNKNYDVAWPCFPKQHLQNNNQSAAV